MDYRSWLKVAEDRLELLRAQRSAIDADISRLESAISTFAPLLSENSAWSGPGIGVTDGVREVFRSYPTTSWLPPGIRDEMLKRGVTLAQNNPLAVIHQIIARLVARQEVEPVEFQGKTYYRWKGVTSDMIPPVTGALEQGKASRQELPKRVTADMIPHIDRAAEQGRASRPELPKRVTANMIPHVAGVLEQGKVPPRVTAKMLASKNKNQK